MRKNTISLFPVIVGIFFFLFGRVCAADNVPFGILNPYYDSAPKKKAYLVKPYINDLGIKWVTANIFWKKVESKPGVFNWKEPDFLAKDIFKDWISYLMSTLRQNGRLKAASTPATPRPPAITRN